MNKNNNLIVYFYGHDKDNNHIDIDDFNSTIRDKLIELDRDSIIQPIKHDISLSKKEYPAKRFYPYLLDDEFEELFYLYKSILKSISKKIMKRDPFIRKHIKELQKKKLNIFYFDELAKYSDLDSNKIPKTFIYPPAYAYLMWRKDILKD